MAQHYRVILYDGDQKWIDKQLDHSIHGTKKILPSGEITAADVDPGDAHTIEFCRNAIRSLQATVSKPASPLCIHRKCGGEIIADWSNTYKYEGSEFPMHVCIKCGTEILGDAEVEITGV